MAFELDHVFLFCSPGAEEASHLTAFGLTEGTPNTHAGQGTACRRFFFTNFYIELLWVCDADEARSEATRLTRLWERWEGRVNGACPFGFGFRPKGQHAGGNPFTGWDYRPPYLPVSFSIHVATNAGVLREPMLFYLPFAQRPDAYPPARQPPLRHRPGLREVTRVALASRYTDNLSPDVAAVAGTGLVQFRPASEYFIELGFDGEARGERADFRPSLPLLFQW